MQLPKDHKVDVGRLSGVFKSTVASYKFYWFLAIIEAAELGEEQVDKKALFASMIANAWYTVNYFQVSFGQKDLIGEKTKELKKIEPISIDEKKDRIKRILTNSANKNTIQILNHFNKNVPHKFLSPWYGSKNPATIYEYSQQGVMYPPYALYPDYIFIQPDWMTYFRENAGILKAFCYWNLALFLQSRNPNVPDIPNKLQRPGRRGGLNKHKKEFWDIVVDELNGVECIYTGEKLYKGQYAVEHFIPFQFVVHDQMWNLIPANPSFNSSKSDKLPPLNRYFDGFFDLQEKAVEIVKNREPGSKFLEDYQLIFRSKDFSKEQYRELIEPLLTIAHNNGFQYME